MSTRAASTGLSRPAISGVLTVVPKGRLVPRIPAAIAATATAAIAAGMRGASLPFGTSVKSPEIAGLESPVEAARVLIGALPPTVALEALVLAAIAVAIPFATSLWRIACLGAGALVATLLVAPTAPALPLIAAVWLTCAALAWRHERQSRSD